MARENQHLETIWGPTTTQIPDRSVAQGIEDITATGELLLDAVPRKTPFLAPPCTGATAPHGCGLRHGALALARYRIPVELQFMYAFTYWYYRNNIPPCLESPCSFSRISTLRLC